MMTRITATLVLSLAFAARAAAAAPEWALRQRIGQQLPLDAVFTERHREGIAVEVLFPGQAGRPGL